jgi:tRNA (mo5U34)-methyltransferase
VSTEGAETAAPQADLRAVIAEREWYHSIEVAPGVVTAGWMDTRAVAGKIGLPESLAGKRCLDVGTFDGFWAFELERRGAAEVQAIDILDPLRWDWPATAPPEVIAGIGERKGSGEGFDICRQALGSKVVRKERSIYDLNPAEDGEYDFIYVGSLLLHLRDPVAALAAVRSVCRGELVVLDAIDPLLSLLFRKRPVAGLDGLDRPWWWKPNVQALARMVRSAGFEPSRPPLRVRIRGGAGQKRPRPSRALLRSHEARVAFTLAHLGDPHCVIHARPR